MGQIDHHVLKNKAEYKVDDQHGNIQSFTQGIKYWFNRARMFEI